MTDSKGNSLNLIDDFYWGDLLLKMLKFDQKDRLNADEVYQEVLKRLKE
jgi:hypothetical protein